MKGFFIWLAKPLIRKPPMDVGDMAVEVRDFLMAIKRDSSKLVGNPRTAAELLEMEYEIAKFYHKYVEGRNKQ